MKYITSAILLALSTTANANDGTVVSEKDYQLPTCTAPVASIMIGNISCKAQACQSQSSNGNDPAAAIQGLMAFAQSAQEGVYRENFAGIGEGFGAMLTTTLQQTGCFEIQDREAMAQLKEEMELVGLEFKPKVADFMVTGAVTSISAETKKRKVGGAFAFVAGSKSQTQKSAEIALDIRILETQSGSVQASSTFVGNNQSTSNSRAGAAFGGILVGGMASSHIKGTPMESVVRDVLARVATYTANQIIAAKTPAAPDQAAIEAVGAVEPVSVETASAD